jgi:chromate reductase
VEQIDKGGRNMSQLHIVGFCGSIRKDSINKALLLQASKLLPESCRFTYADISQVPHYNQDLEHDLPASVRELAQLAQSADGFLISTPEYNYSVPGVLKNALDWLSRQFVGTPLANKPVAIMGATPGMFGTARGQIHLRDILFGLNMNPVNRPEVLIAEGDKKLDVSSGVLTDETGLQFLKQLVDNLVDAVERGR